MCGYNNIAKSSCSSCSSCSEQDNRKNRTNKQNTDMTQEELERTQAQQRRIEWLLDVNHGLRQEIAAAHKRIARLEGLCEGLREAAKTHKQPQAAPQQPTQAAPQPQTDDEDNNTPRRQTTPSDEFIYQQLRQRKTYAEIAKAVGLGAASIRMWTSKRGIRAHRNKQGVYYTDTIGRFLPSTLEKYENERQSKR